VANCPNCSITLTYHRKAEQLSCHLCGHVAGVPKMCPNPACRDPAIRYSGMGTEKVEAAIQKAFPKARVQRMDSDMMTRKTLYREILGAFRIGKIDILVGTQMIAKGLHFPNVTLVGIIYADMALHMPDFRAGERTFQLLVQVAGRAGRGDVEGEVIVQSFTPYHGAVQYARQHDYLGFYEQEIEFREQLRYPPITRMLCITVRGRSEDKAKFVAEVLARDLKKQVTPDVLMGGPTPAPLARIQNQYRFQIILRSEQIMRLTEAVGRVASSTKLPDDVNMTIDVDPISLL
jgi:primosomal protein N' (replication factor Y)